MNRDDTTVERTFDRRVRFDERSRAFNIREVTPFVQRSYTWGCPQYLDQGSEGACVGFGWAHELLSRPGVIRGLTDQGAKQIYRQARRRDDLPGEDYSGTSVLAGAKVVTAARYILEYRWAFSFDDLCLAVGHHGPAVLGLNWYDGMLEPNSTGFIAPTGEVVGGHCILMTGVNFRIGRVVLHNSWGPDWGSRGYCFVRFDDMARLLSEDGEACIPTIRRRIEWTGVSN